MIDTYRAGRRLEIGDEIREPGEPVPEAHRWRLADGLVSGGQLEKMQLSEADFVEAVERYCPDEADLIYTQLELTPVKKDKPVNRPKSHPAKTVLATEPKKIDEDAKPSEPAKAAKDG